MAQARPDLASPVDNVRGAFWMVGAAMGFASSGICIKALGAHHLPAFEISFMRCLMGLVLLVPTLVRHGFGIYRTPRIDLHLIRIMCSTVSITGGVYAISHMHLATATALSFTRPLFGILVARLVLGEKAGLARSVATVIGFVGILIVTQPGTMSVPPFAAFAGLAAAACLAGTTAVIRRQSATDGTATILAWYLTGCCVTMAIPAALDWQTPASSDWGLLGLMALGGSAGQYMLVRAFALGEATVMNPIDYSQIIVIALAGYFLFGEIPPLATVIGTAIIVASTLYIVLRKSVPRADGEAIPS